jgi:hypothetical protein
MVSAAFGTLGEDSRTRASRRGELKDSFRPDVPMLDPDRTGTGGFDELLTSRPPVRVCLNFYSLNEDR